MKSQQEINYEKIAEAIEYIHSHFREQPTIEEVAHKMNLSPFHFRQLFKEWSGTTPKKLFQFLHPYHARRLIEDNRGTLFDAVYNTELSETEPLHQLFVKIERMSPDESKNGGKGLQINYSFWPTPFGRILIASTTKGICSLLFTSEETESLSSLIKQFPNAVLLKQTDSLQRQAASVFHEDRSYPKEITLHLKATDFQLKIWELLLKIPLGGLSTYGKIAKEIKQPTASRAVGTAIGSNPVAFLIPCHRVIQSSGDLGGYLWGHTRKSAIIAWESIQRAKDKNE